MGWEVNEVRVGEKKEYREYDRNMSINDSRVDC